MKKFLSVLVLAIASILTINCSAQTYRASATSQHPFSCGPTGVYCYGVPFYLNGDVLQPESTPWVDVTNPLSGNGFIDFTADNDQGPLAQYGTVSVDANSMTTTYASFTSPGRPSVTAIASISFSFGGNLGTFAATFNHFYASGSGRGGGGSGWKTTLTGGTIVINQSSGAVTETISSPDKPRPEYGGYILICGWRGVFPPYLPTGAIGVDGVQVGADCYYKNTLTGDDSTSVLMTWWIPWSTWFLPPAQIPNCENSNYLSSACTQYANIPAIKASTPQHPSL